MMQVSLDHYHSKLYRPKVKTEQQNIFARAVAGAADLVRPLVPALQLSAPRSAPFQSIFSQLLSVFAPPTLHSRALMMIGFL